MRAAIIILFAASTAHADGNELWFGGGSRALRSASADAVTADSLDIGALGYARALDLDVPRIAIAAETGFSWGTASGTMFQTLDTKISTQAFFVGARARYPLHRMIDATARLDVGSARAALAVASGSDSGWGAMAQGALGLDLYAARSPEFGLGLRTELGYVATTAIAMTPRADQPRDTLQLQMADASIGHLDLSGPWFAISVIGTF